MRVSVFTPSHDIRYLSQAYESLRGQSFGDSEWIVLLNRRASQWKPPDAEECVKVRRAPAGARGVGAAECAH